MTLKMLAAVMGAGMMAGALAGCGNRTVRVDLVPTETRLQQQVVESSGSDLMTNDKIAMITVSGLIANASKGNILSAGQNPVSDFRETLDAIAQDPSVKAVLLRINSPGGTVTASDMMYKDLLAFRKKTGKPVVTCMMDVCASGGYYLSCASDYRVAYPTTITGSIGVIIETVNVNGTLKKIGVATEAVKSAENKDMGSPFKPARDADRPLSEEDRALLQGIVNQFYGNFQEVVKASPHKVKPENWTMVTDGRVVTGKDAVGLGLIDEVGDIDSAIAKAKSLANISRAKIVTYTRSEEGVGSVYATAPAGGAQAGQGTVNMLNINLDLDSWMPRGQAYYLWQGFGAE